MFLARASVAAGPRIARQRLVVLLSSSRSLASFVPASRPVAWGVRSAPTVACSLGSNPGRSERHFSAQWPGLRPKDGQRRVVDDRIYVGNLPMGFTEDGLRELVDEPVPSKVEMGVPKPKAVTAHGFLDYDSPEDAKAAMAKVQLLSRDAGPLIAKFAGRPLTEEQLEKHKKRKAQNLERIAAHEAEMAAWQRQVNPPSKTLRIGGLYRVTDKRLTEALVPLLEGWPCQLTRNADDDGRPQSFAHVSFKSVQEATTALEKLRTTDLDRLLGEGVSADFPRHRSAYETIPKPDPLPWRKQQAGSWAGKGRSSGYAGGNSRPISSRDGGRPRPSSGWGDAGERPSQRKDGFGLKG